MCLARGQRQGQVSDSDALLEEDAEGTIGPAGRLRIRGSKDISGVALPIVLAQRADQRVRVQVDEGVVDNNVSF